MTVKTAFGSSDQAKNIRFAPEGGIEATNVQDAIVEVKGAVDELATSTFVYPEDFGTIADGVDCREIVQQAADQAVALGAELRFRPRTYTITSASATSVSGFAAAVVLPNKSVVHIPDGCVIDISGMGDDKLGLLSQGSETATVAVSVNVVVGDSVITTATPTGWAAGELIRLGSDRKFDAASTETECGEILRIKEISDTTITVFGEVVDSYATADNAVVSRITPVSVKITGSGLIRGAGRPTDQMGIVVLKSDNCVISGINVDRCTDRAIWLVDVVNCQDIRPGKLTNCESTGTGYGVSFTDCCQDLVISDYYAEFVGHAFSTNNTSASRGVPRRIDVVNVKCNTTTLRGPLYDTPADAFDTHTAAEDIRFIGCTAVNPTGIGFNMECPSGEIIGCTVINSGGDGIGVHNESDRDGRVIIDGNYVERCGGTGISVQQGARTIGLEVVEGIARGAVVTSNIVHKPGTLGIHVEGEANPIENAVIDGNSVFEPQSTSVGILLNKARGFAVGDNVVKMLSTNAVADGIRVSDSKEGTVTGNTVTLPASAAQDCIDIRAVVSGDGSNIIVTGNVGGGDTPTSSVGLRIDNEVNNVTIGVNDFQRCTTAYNLGSGTGHRMGVLGPLITTDNALVRWDGASGRTIQNSALVVDDSGNATGLTTITLPNAGLRILDTNASHPLLLRPGSDLTLARSLTLTTGDADRTLTLSADLTVSGASTVNGTFSGALNGTGLVTAGAQTLTGGFNATSFNAGSKSTGTFTPNPLQGNFQHATNDGAHTLAPPVSDCRIIIQYTNGVAAGAVTTSGFTKVTGDVITTTSGHDFHFEVTRVNAFSHLHVVALQ